MTFAEALRSLRKKAGLTQAQLAEKVGVTPPAVNQYESGERRPSAEIVLRLTAALSLPVVPAMGLLSLAGYSSRDWDWREKASRDIEEFLEGTQNKAPGGDEYPHMNNDSREITKTRGGT